MKHFIETMNSDEIHEVFERMGFLSRLLWKWNFIFLIPSVDRLSKVTVDEASVQSMDNESKSPISPIQVDPLVLQGKQADIAFCSLMLKIHSTSR